MNATGAIQRPQFRLSGLPLVVNFDTPLQHRLQLEARRNSTYGAALGSWVEVLVGVGHPTPPAVVLNEDAAVKIYWQQAGLRDLDANLPDVVVVDRVATTIHAARGAKIGDANNTCMQAAQGDGGHRLRLDLASGWVHGDTCPEAGLKLGTGAVKSGASQLTGFACR